MQPPSKSALRNIRYLILLVLIILLGIQSWDAVQKIRIEIVDVYKVNFKPALWRGAFFARSANFADTIWFLNQQIPADARVILPPREAGLEEFGITPLMQYFLAPRHLINITDLDKYVTSLADGGAYLLVQGIGNSPSGEISEERLIMQDDTRGVYTPTGVELSSNQENAPPNDTPSKIQTALVTIVLLGIIAIAGYATVMSLFPIRQKFLALVLGLGIGLGLNSFLIYLLSLMFEFSLITILVGTGIFLFISLSMTLLKTMIARKRGAADSLIPPKIALTWIDLLWYLVFLTISGLVALVAVGKGFHTSDALMLWGARGYGIAADGLREGASSWGTLAMAYPLNIPLLIATSQKLGLEILPASKIIFPIAYLCLTVTLYEFLKLYLPASLSGIFSLLFSTTPLIVQHAKIAYANLPLTFYLIVSLYLFTRLFKDKFRSPALILTGMALALAAWTRPEGEILSGLTLAVFCLAIWLDRRIDTKSKWISTLSITAPVALYFVIWHTTSGIVYPSAVSYTGLLQQMLQSWANGNLQLPALLEIGQYSLQQWFSYGTWGISGYIWLAILILVVLLSFFRRYRLSRGLILIGILTIVYVITIWGIYYLTSFDQGQELRWWLTTGYNRMNMPASVLLWVTIGLLLAPLFSDKAGKTSEAI